LLSDGRKLAKEETAKHVKMQEVVILLVLTLQYRMMNGEDGPDQERRRQRRKDKIREPGAHSGTKPASGTFILLEYTYLHIHFPRGAPYQVEMAPKPTSSFSLPELSISQFALAWALVFLIIRSIYRHVSIRRFKAQNGCKAPPTIQGGGFLGSKMAKESDKALEKGQYLALLRSRFARTGNTYEGSIFGMDFVATIEPENIKAILTRVDDFSKAGRMTDWWPMLQGGILVADGHEWKVSRVCLLQSSRLGFTGV